MIVITALPGRYRSTTGRRRFIVSLRAAGSILPRARRTTPTPYITAPIQAIPNMMWKNRSTTPMTADASTTGRGNRPAPINHGRILISPAGFRGTVSHLLDAIHAETRGDFRTAAEHYRHLTESGSPLDRVGIYQALARCHEKLGDLTAGGQWRRKAGKTYLELPDASMAKDERQYLALVEYRNAVQDLAGDPSLKEVASEYKAVLAENWKGGPEGLTHEGLFGGIFLMGLGDHAAATRYLFDSAEAISEQATELHDPVMRDAARHAYELARVAAMESGNMQIAQVAEVRAVDLARA